ncbi:hypothetical protein [Lachnobacterium bovis]|uniref:hypothetical protein n=1 Tax=Lachnobacterium bovis TaxID=140626 RepID=UPI00048E0D98|nr:hypothetical protein [Lachnobacterium bovis]
MYSFDVYNPWKNDIDYSLDAQNLLCTKYELSDNHLLCFSKKKKTLSIYDDKLSLLYRLKLKEVIGSEDYDNFTYSLNLAKDTLYALNKDGTLYTIKLSNKIKHHTFLSFLEQKESFSKATFKKSNFTFKDCYIIGENNNDDTFYVRGVNLQNYCYSYGVFDKKKEAIKNSFLGTAYYKGDATEEHIVTQIDYNRGYWKLINAKKNKTSYFRAQDCVNATPYDNNLMLRKDIGYDKSVKRQNITSVFTAYSSTGKVLSSIQIDFGNAQKGEENYLSKDQIYLKHCSCFFILKYDLKGNPFLYIWKLNGSTNKTKPEKSHNNDDSQQDGTKNNNVQNNYTTSDISIFDNLLALQNSASNETGIIIDNMKNDNSQKMDSYKSVREYADSLEKTYGVKIYLGPQVPKKIDVFNVKQNLDTDEIKESLDTLNKILSAYPTDFFKQLRFSDIYGIRIYIASTISSRNNGMISDPSGFVNTIDSYLVMVLDSSYSWDWPYTVNHEFSHMIDRKLEFETSYNHKLSYSEDNWNKNNPAGFEYLQTYDNYSNSKGYSKFPKYFIDSYGTTFATEDRAEIFGNAMSYYLNGDNKRFFLPDSPIRNKHAYYCKCIREGFNSSKWDSIMPWERCINE